MSQAKRVSPRFRPASLKTKSRYDVIIIGRGIEWIQVRIQSSKYIVVVIGKGHGWRGMHVIDVVGEA